MRLRILAAALAGGALALTAAAPALAGAGAPRNTLTAAWSPTSVEAGGTATISWTLGQPGDPVADGVVTITHPEGLAFQASGDQTAQCTDTGTLLSCTYTDMAHGAKSDHATFAVAAGFTPGQVTSRVRVDLHGCDKPLTARATLAVTAPASPSPTPSDSPSESPSESPSGSPSESPSDSPSGQPTSEPPSASPSESTARSGTASAQPSLTLAGGGSGGSGSLPVTGTSLGLIAGGAVALLGGGTALLVLIRRRRTES